MSKRKLILIISILIILAIIVFGVFNFYKTTPTETVGEDTKGENFIADFLNFGKNNKTPSPQEENPEENILEAENNSITEIEMQKMKLSRISSIPIAGFTLFMKERFTSIEVAPSVLEDKQEKAIPAKETTEFVPALRYVEKATGNVYQTFVDNIDERKFSNTTIPTLHEAYFGDYGDMVIMRYLKIPSIQDINKTGTGNHTIATFTGSFPKEVLGADSTNGNELNGSFLPENITDISISPDTSLIFYLFNWKEGVAGTTASFLGANKAQIFDSQYTEWLSQWPNKNMITLTTKPASGVPGYMYTINPITENFKKVLGGINGLTTLTSPDGKLVLYGNDKLSLNIYNIDTGESQSLRVNTLPEKCIWGESSNIIYCTAPKFINEEFSYPDAWYQGEISFSDDIWKIDVLSGNASIILKSSLDDQNTTEIDGIKLVLDSAEDYLFIINKKDSYLWGLELK
jgi:hypothetical protein